VIYIFRDCELGTARFELRREGTAQPVEPCARAAAPAASLQDGLRL